MTSSELREEQNKTLQKIGRNILNFQRMEAMLKFVVSRYDLSGNSIEELKENHSYNVKATSRKTMGNLVKELFDSIYISGENKQNELNDARFSLSISVETEPESLEMQKKSLERIVEERNHLVHQMLSEFNQSSIQSCIDLSLKLDEQAERLKPEYESLLSLIQTFKQAAEDLTKKNIT